MGIATTIATEVYPTLLPACEHARVGAVRSSIVSSELL